MDVKAVVKSRGDRMFITRTCINCFQGSGVLALRSEGSVFHTPLYYLPMRRLLRCQKDWNSIGFTGGSSIGPRQMQMPSLATDTAITGTTHSLHCHLVRLTISSICSIARIGQPPGQVDHFARTREFSSRSAKSRPRGSTSADREVWLHFPRTSSLGRQRVIVTPTMTDGAENCPEFNVIGHCTCH